MGTFDLPIDGSCRCGQVQMRIIALPILTMACHCKGCQKMSASAFSLSAAIPAKSFEVVLGEPVIGGMRDPKLRHFFCPHCMSWLFTRFAPEFVNVRATMFNDLTGIAPFIETWTRTRLPWTTVPAVHSYEEFPPPDAFARLAEEFSQTLAQT